MKKLYFITIALAVIALSACRSGNEAATVPAQAVVEEVAQQDDSALEQVAVEPSEEEIAAAEAAAKAEAARIARARRLAAKRAAEKAEAERLAAEQAEAERLAAEQAEAARLAAEKAEAERLAAEKAEQERLAAEAAAKAEAERLAAEAAAKAEAERLAAEAAARLKQQIKPLYLQLQGGVNYLASEGGRVPVFGHNGLVGGEAAIVLGGELSRVWGLRGGIGYGYNRTRNLNDLSSVSSLPFHSVEAFFGTTIDWLDINPNRQNFNWDFYSFVDLAYLCTLPRPAFEPAMSSAVSHNGGLRLGLHVGRKLTERFALGLEGAIMFMTDQFSGKTGSVMADGRGTINVTCTWTLGK